MPSAATDTDTFQATIQRPNNGELADSASLSQFVNPIVSRTRHVYNRSRGNLFDIARAPYNADPTGAASSQAAFDAAIAAAAATGGDVFVPPGTYLYTGLTIPQGVNIYAAPDVYLSMNHASANGVVTTDPNDGPPSVVSGIRFLGNVVNTGTCVINNGEARVIFERCSWNGFNSGGGPSNNLQGKIAYTGAANSELTFIDCRIAVAGTQKGLHAVAGKIRVVRGAISVPAVHSDALAYSEGASTLTLDGVRLDFSAHTTGTTQGLFAATADANAFAAMRGCEIESDGALGTNYAFYWFADANVVMQGNYIDTINVKPFGQFSAPSARSSVDLLDYVQQDWGTNTAIDLRSTYGYRTHLVRNNAGSVSIILPAGVMDGQELDFIYYSSSTSVMPSFATTPLTATTVPTIVPGNTLTGRFRWVKREASGDSDRWIQVGTWGVGLTLV